MFGVARADERLLVGAAVDAPGERTCKKGALVVAAFLQAPWMERHGHDDVDVVE